MKNMNAMDVRDDDEAAKLGLVRKGVNLSLADDSDEGVTFAFGCYVNQLAKGEDSWELIFSQDCSQFAVLYLKCMDIKTLADFLGECARAASKFMKE